MNIYYDNDGAHLMAEGEYKDFIQNGLWKFYDRDGNVVQEGKYDQGTIFGSWKYNLPECKDSIVNWVKRKVDLRAPVEFCLPSNFRDYYSDSAMLMVVDTLTSDVFSIRTISVDEYDSAIAIQDPILKQLTIEGGIVNAVSIATVDSKDGMYFYDKIEASAASQSIQFVVYNIYKRVDENYLVWSYTCSPKNASGCYFFLGEIFHHTLYDGEIVQHPLYETSVRFR